MAKYLFLVECNCKDAAQEGAFNTWYNEVHVPDIMKLPGVISAKRWEDIEPAAETGKYLAMYEIEIDDIEKVKQAIVDSRPVWTAGNRLEYVPILELMHGLRWFKQILSIPE